MNWIIGKGTDDTYSIGYYRPGNVKHGGDERYTLWSWVALKHFDTYEEAAEEIHYLNGGERGNGVYPV